MPNNIKNPLAFYSLALTVLESVIAISASIKFDNEELLYKLFIILILVFVALVSLVSYIVIKYPKNLSGEFEKVTDSLIKNLSNFNKEILLKLNNEGVIKYNSDDKDNYKDLRNLGLIRTSNRLAMRKDDTILLTELGVIITSELIEEQTP